MCEELGNKEHVEKYFTQLHIIYIPCLSQSWMTAFITLFKKQILAKIPFSYCVSTDKIFLMNKNTLNSLNAEDKNYTPHYNSQGGKKKYQGS